MGKRKANRSRLLFYLLFLSISLPFCGLAIAQDITTASHLYHYQKEKWPYKQPVYLNGQLYGHFKFSEGLAPVTHQHKTGFVDSAYSLVIPLLYENTRNYAQSEGSNVVKSHEAMYEDAYQFKNNRAIVQQNGKWGIIDTEGKAVTAFEYTAIFRFLDHYFLVQQQNEFAFTQAGILDSTGNIIIPVRYSWPATPFRSEAALLEQVKLEKEQAALKNRLQVSESQAIAIARKAGFYTQNNWLFVPEVIYDAASGQWQITSTLSGYTRAGKCKYTNGCTTRETKTILINAETGKITHRSVKKSEFPNYER